MAEDFTPRFVGDLSRPLLATFTTHDGTVDSLVSATNLRLWMRNIATLKVSLGTGTWAIQGTGSTGQAIYTYSAADMAAPGFFNIWPDATMGDGPTDWDDTHILEIRTKT